MVIPPPPPPTPTPKLSSRPAPHAIQVHIPFSAAIQERPSDPSAAASSGLPIAHHCRTYFKREAASCMHPKQRGRALCVAPLGQEVQRNDVQLLSPGAVETKLPMDQGVATKWDRSVASSSFGCLSATRGANTSTTRARVHQRHQKITHSVGDPSARNMPFSECHKIKKLQPLPRGNRAFN